MRFVADVGGREHTVEVEANGHDRRMTLDGREITLDWRLLGAEQPRVGTGGGARADHYSLLAGTRTYDAYVRSLAEPGTDAEAATHTLEVVIGGRPYVVTVRDARSQALADIAAAPHSAGDATVRAPMPGLVTQVLVAVGDEVRRGQTVIVLEAMKMENDLAAPRAGVVKVVSAVRGQAVNQNDSLVAIGEPGEQPPDEPDA
jgi:biotin carboxyl carrier protein